MLNPDEGIFINNNDLNDLNDDLNMILTKFINLTEFTMIFLCHKIVHISYLVCRLMNNFPSTSIVRLLVIKSRSQTTSLLDQKFVTLKNAQNPVLLPSAPTFTLLSPYIQLYVIKKPE
jgi:hypothetical protein